MHRHWLTSALVVSVALGTSAPALAQPKPAKPTRPVIQFQSWVELSSFAADLERLHAYVDNVEYRSGSCRLHGNPKPCTQIRIEMQRIIVDARKHSTKLIASASKARDATGLDAVKSAVTILNQTSSRMATLTVGSPGSSTARFREIQQLLGKSLDFLSNEHAYARRPEANLGARITGLSSYLHEHLKSGSPLSTEQLTYVQRQASLVRNRWDQLLQSNNAKVTHKLNGAKTQHKYFKDVVAALPQHNDRAHLTKTQKATQALARKLL